MILSPRQGQIVVTQKFGERPEVYKRFGLKGHNGIDFRAPVGTPLFAPIEGEITKADEGDGGYGKHIRIKSGNKEVVIGHLSAFANFGSSVSLGDPIGFSGNTGFSTAPHIHLGVRKLKDGQVVDAGNGFAGYFDVLPYILVGWRVI